MYRSDLDTRHKGGAIVGVVAIHAALALALLHLSGTVDLTDVQEGLSVFDVTEVTSPPQEVPPPPPQKAAEQQKAEKPAGGSEPNIKSEATPIVAPKPPVQLPVPSPVATTETPREGVAPTQGAAPIPGPGTGSGGSGTGSGGGAGAGRGGGGEGFAVVRTRLATRPLRGRDFPPALLDAWPPGARVLMRMRIDANGVPIQCIVDFGTGNAAIDAQICAIAKQRLRYRPALNRKRQRVADWAAYGQEPPH
ncbi:hypothetical protein G7077_09735 [Sphingomonas piscis]|uniref:Energy transducer TonB n=1 Tax=Sphingomonas piscis TaxID=2714943 RepID=A0A6G7YQX3_9SPHN|nr:hypothetical protein [Sphingomonas piscis]QIK79136.1 hypothetical protein G7077_09735 [Sphingomonas piscis]